MTTTSFDNFPPELKQAFLALAQAQASAQASIEKSQAATQRQIDATTATVNKTSRDIDKLYKLYGSNDQNKGDETEEFFYNTLLHDPMIGKIKFDKVLSNHMVGTKGKETEFDLLLINGNSLALVEIKNKYHVNDLDQVEEHLSFLRKHSPEYKAFKFYGGIAGFSIPNDVVKAAHERGYFVLKRVGKLMSSNTERMTAF